MAKKATLTTLSANDTSNVTANSNFDKLNEAFENTLSRDGSTPNNMGADLDMDSNDILNVKGVYADNVYLNGSAIEAASASFDTRGEFITWVNAGNTVSDGTVVSAEGLSYLANQSATSIPELPGFEPIGSVGVEHFGGGTSKTATQNAQAFYDASEYLVDQGGGVVELGSGTYTFGPSPSTKTYENGGNLLPASNAAMIVLPSISVRGKGVGQTKIVMSAQTVQPFYLVSPDGCEISGMEIDGQWDGSTATSRSGIQNVIPSDADLTKAMDEDFSVDVGDFSAAGTDFSIAVSSGALRGSYGASYTGGGVASASISTSIGTEYRIIIYPKAIPVGPSDNALLRVSASTDATTANIFAEKYVGDKVGDYGHTLTFTATGTTTYILIDHDAGTQTDLQSTFWDIDEIRVAAFSTAEQMNWCRNVTIKDTYGHDFGAYGYMLQDGDIRGCRIERNHIKTVRGDGIDFKQRGPTADTYAIWVVDNLIEDVCLLLSGTAAIDLRGNAVCRGNTIRRFSDAGLDCQGIRARTYDDLTAPYGGDSSKGCIVSEFFISGNNGTGRAVQVGAENVKVFAGTIEGGGPIGLGIVGNTFGSSDYTSLSDITVEDYTLAFDLNTDKVSATSCSAGGTTGTAFDVSGSDCVLTACNDGGATTPLTYTGSGLIVNGGTLSSGTFSPHYSQGANDAAAYTTRLGYYTWQGREISYHIVLNPSDIGSCSGAIIITDLPFTSLNVSGLEYSAAVGHWSGMALGANGKSIIARVPANDTKVQLYVEDSPVSITSLQHTEWPAGGKLALSGRYIAA